MLYGQSWELAFERLVLGLSGIVFLGSPHPRLERKEDSRKLGLLLKYSTTLSKSTIETSEQTLTAVTSVSESFDNTKTNVPILSVYEGKGTRVARSRFSRKREIVSRDPNKHGF